MFGGGAYVRRLEDHRECRFQQSLGAFLACPDDVMEVEALEGAPQGWVCVRGWTTDAGRFLLLRDPVGAARGLSDQVGACARRPRVFSS